MDFGLSCSALNTLLSSSQTRYEGISHLSSSNALSLFQDAEIQKHAVSWLREIVGEFKKVPFKCLPRCGACHYEAAETILYYAQSVPDLKRDLTSGVVYDVVDAVIRIDCRSDFHTFEVLRSGLSCLYTCLRYFCGHVLSKFKSKILLFLLPFFDHTSPIIRQISAECVACLSLHGAETTGWTDLVKRLVGSTHHLLNNLPFSGTDLTNEFVVSNLTTAEILPLSPLNASGSNETFSHRLHSLIVSICHCLRLPSKKELTVPIATLLFLSFRLASQSSSLFGYEQQFSFALQCRICSLRIIDAVILSCGFSVLRFGSNIHEIFRQYLSDSLKLDSQGKQGKQIMVLKRQLYETLNAWASLGISSHMERHFLSLWQLVKTDLNFPDSSNSPTQLFHAQQSKPKPTPAPMIGGGTTSKKRKRRQLVAMVLNDFTPKDRVTSHDFPRHFYPKLCLCALKSMKTAIVSCSSILPHSFLKDIVTCLINNLVTVRARSNQSCLASLPCRLMCYKILVATTPICNDTLLNSVVSCLRNGCLDPNMKIVSYCRESLVFCSFLSVNKPSILQQTSIVPDQTDAGTPTTSIFPSVLNEPELSGAVENDSRRIEVGLSKENTHTYTNTCTPAGNHADANPDLDLIGNSAKETGVILNDPLNLNLDTKHQRQLAAELAPLIVEEMKRLLNTEHSNSQTMLLSNGTSTCNVGETKHDELGNNSNKVSNTSCDSESVIAPSATSGYVEPLSADEKTSSSKRQLQSDTVEINSGNVKRNRLEANFSPAEKLVHETVSPDINKMLASFIDLPPDAE